MKTTGQTCVGIVFQTAINWLSHILDRVFDMLYYCEMEIELRFSKSIKKFWHFDALNWTLTFSQFSLDLLRWSDVGSLINCTFELISNTHLHTVVSKYFNTLHCFYIYLFGFQSNSIDFHSNWLLVTTEHFNLQQKETMNENTPHFIIAVNYYWEVDSEKKIKIYSRSHYFHVTN